MNGTKHLAFAVALTFLAGLFLSTQAQVISNQGTKLQSIEISPGIEDPEKGIINGISFLGNTTGLFPGSFFMSLNYTTTPMASFPTVPNTIRGGTWSLPVYRSGEYLGAIYGRVVDGMLQWNDTNSVAWVTLTLSADGGTQTFEKERGKAYFVGTLDRTTKDKPQMNGTLSFEF